MSSYSPYSSIAMYSASYAYIIACWACRPPLVWLHLSRFGSSPSLESPLHFDPRSYFQLPNLEMRESQNCPFATCDCIQAFPWLYQSDCFSWSVLGLRTWAGWQGNKHRFLVAHRSVLSTLSQQKELRNCLA